jgi:hypothetical protein
MVSVKKESLMRGKSVKWVGDFRVYEELDAEGVVIGYTVVSPDGTISAIFGTLKEALDYAFELRKKYVPSGKIP